MARRSVFRGVSPAVLLPIAALALVCLLLQDNYAALRSQHALTVHGTEVPPWARGRHHRGGGGGDSSTGGSSSRGGTHLSADAWAGGHVSSDRERQEQLRAMLSADEQKQLMELCGRCLWHTLTEFAVAHGGGHLVHVPTGDIPDMWIRDSSVQMGIYIPRVRRRPALRRLVEGTLRTQALFITQDPYANAYYKQWRKPTDLAKTERIIGRGGWVGTHNYELDSGAYFISLLWSYYVAPDVHAPELLVNEPVVFDAVRLMLDVWVTEQHHDERSRYRYSELPRDGRGPLVNYTGMTWSAYRPSDDPTQYGYLVPANIYAAGALERVLELNRAVWQDDALGLLAAKLLSDIESGIEKHGIIDVEGERIYAYEVDGMGNHLADFDDANVPSLLSIPLLGWSRYDKKVYEATRRRLLSPKNSHYFEGPELRGIGSPHTPSGYVWPIALAVQGLTSKDLEEQAYILRTMLKLQCGNGLMHESVSTQNLTQCTRPVFEWANAMLVVLVENLLGRNCEEAAEAHRLATIKKREKADNSTQPQNGGADLTAYYESLEDSIRFANDNIPSR